MDILSWILVHGDQFLTWGLVTLASVGVAFLLKQIKSDKVREIVGRALHEVGAAVWEVKQTYVDELKAASLDGKLTDEEKKAAMDKAIAIAKTNIGMKGLDRLGRILNLDLSGVEKWLKNKAEVAVGQISSPR